MSLPSVCADNSRRLSLFFSLQQLPCINGLIHLFIQPFIHYFFNSFFRRFTNSFSFFPLFLPFSFVPSLSFLSDSFLPLLLSNDRNSVSQEHCASKKGGGILPSLLTAPHLPGGPVSVDCVCVCVCVYRSINPLDARATDRTTPVPLRRIALCTSAPTGRLLVPRDPLSRPSAQPQSGTHPGVSR